MSLGTPLLSRNRLNYVPPSFQPQDNEDLTYDFSQSEDVPHPGSSMHLTASLWRLILNSYTIIYSSILKHIIEAWNTPSQNPFEVKVSTDATSDSIDSKESFINRSETVSPSPPAVLSETVLIDSSPEPASQDLYGSLFELDSDFESDQANQYGTTLAVSKDSGYRPHSAVSSREPTDEVDATTFLHNELPSLDDYDKVIKRFYEPIKPIPKSSYSLTEALLAAIPSYTEILSLKKERQEIQDLIHKERSFAKTKVQSLSRDEAAQVERAWSSRNAGQILVSAYSIDITVRDLRTLCDSCWLNDNVIDFYLNLISDRAENTYCWTTHFYTTLKDKGYQGVARWAKRRKVDLTKKDLVIVPINIMGTHWAVSVIDNTTKTIGYYDSLSSKGNLRAVEILKEYMGKESDRLSAPMVDYKLLPNIKTPQQQNGFDCGVFTCTVARYVAQGQPLSFSQSDMRVLRRRMAHEIMTKTLKDDMKSHL